MTSADRKDGGTAFPVMHTIDGNWVPDTRADRMGMSWLDYAAIEALKGIGTWIPDYPEFDDAGLRVNNPQSKLTDPEAMRARAAWAYAQAQAMLTERKVED